MKTSRSMRAAFKSQWQRQPEEFTAEVVHDAKAGIVTIEIPSGGRLAIAADTLRTFLNDVNRREKDGES